MGPIPFELSLDCRSKSTIPSEEYVPRTIGAFISQVSMIGNVSEKLLKLDNYEKRLEDELRKIDAFKRELPLCMLLLSDAITIVKVELVKYKKQNMEPVLEEFIPLNKDCEEDESEKIKIRKDMMDSKDKMNWMSSVQLWNHHYSPELDSNPKEIPKSNAKKLQRTLEDKKGVITDSFLKSCSNAERAFVPFNKVDVELQSTRLLSLDSIGIKRTREGVTCGGMNSEIISRAVSSMPKFQSGVETVSQVQTPTSRKQRRCWSPQLHRRFVEALHQLGGCQVATPKQIRELMQLDGLTNDEVKSHLQKYRLHIQRLPATSNTRLDESHVSLGGSWMSNRTLGESTKQSNLQSDSPQSPPQLCGGTSMTLGDSMEDEDDEKSESHSWKSHVLDK